MLNPLMLLGLLGLGVPILIHLINRQRMKPRQLATLEFLDKQDVANAFAPVPRDLLQLLLRLLLLTLFVLLMARMTGPSATVGPRTVAIVLDNSMSMRRLSADGKTTLFEAHRARILDVVRGMRPGDYFSVTLVGDKVFESTGFSADRLAVERAVTNAWVSDGGGRAVYTATEERARELRSKRAPNMALMVFSDQQAQNYRLPPGSTGLADLLKGSRIKPVFVLDPVQTGPNIEITGAEFSPEKIYVGAGGKVTAHLHNLSDTQMTAVVSLKNGGSVEGSRSCNLVSGETAQVEIRYDFASPNDSAWNVNLAEDGFLPDNDTYTTVRMNKRRDVLLVVPPRYMAGDSMTVGRSGADVFACAVNPSEASGVREFGETYISVKRITPEMLRGRVLSSYSMVAFYGVQELGARDVIQDLKTYVNQGGGVYFVMDDPGDSSGTNVASFNPAGFNTEFADLLCGFKVGGLKELTVPAPLDKGEKNVTDPLFTALLRGQWGTIGDIRYARYFSTLDAGKAKPALKTIDGDTLVAVAEMGKGRVCIQMHSWDVRDTSLTRSLPFVSVVHAIVNWLSTSSGEPVGRPDHIRVGDFHHMDLPQFRGLSNNVDMVGPRTYSFALSSESAQMTLKDIYVAGGYRATHAKKPQASERWLAVNRTTAESDVTYMSAEQLAALCGGQAGAVTTSDRLDGLFRPSRELYPLLMVLVLVALAAETLGSLLSRRKKVSHEPSV